MVSTLIEETLEAAHTALQSASLKVSRVDENLLVGGATRTRVCRRVFGKEARGEVGPDLCVAMGGAAVQGATLAG